MNVVVLSGSSGAFNLANDCIEIAKKTSWDWCIQSLRLESKKITEKIRTEKFINIESIANNCDVLISHCGAGTVFWALEKKIKLIAIVDEDRHDDHQWDLGNYLDHHRFCMVLRGRAPTISEISTACEGQPYCEYIKHGLVDLKSKLSGFKASHLFKKTR